jgi:hypothetical protein
MSTPTEIHLEFTYTYPDIKAATALMKRRRMPSMLSWILILSVAVLIFIVFHNPAPRTAPTIPSTPPPTPYSFLLACINLGPYVLIVAAIIIVGRTSRRRTWEKSNKQELNRVTLSPAGLLWETHDERTESKWTRYDRFLEGPAVFVIPLANNLVQVLPKRAMTPDQITKVRNLLAASIHKTQAFEVLPPTPPSSPTP